MWIGNLLRLHLSNKEGRNENFHAFFFLKFTCYQDHTHQQSFEALCHDQRFGRQTSNRPRLDVLGKLSHKMLSASDSGNLYFQVTG